jgi:hypothetical protein
MNRELFFPLACAALIGAIWAILALVFTEPDVRRALTSSALLAFAVQIVAFLIVRAMAQRKNVIAGWGIGITLRFAALLIFGLVAVPKLNLPLAPALLGLATYLFVSTLIEPLFLKT